MSDLTPGQPPLPDPEGSRPAPLPALPGFPVPYVPPPGPYGAPPPAYGQPPPGPYGAPATRACPACRTPVWPTTSVCPRCGTFLSVPKDKSVAVLLAVFLGAWTWVYTYKRDASKFWVGIVLTLVGYPLVFAFGFGLLVIFGVWLWAVIDTASKSQTYYQQFPLGG